MNIFKRILIGIVALLALIVVLYPFWMPRVVVLRLYVLAMSANPAEVLNQVPVAHILQPRKLAQQRYTKNGVTFQTPWEAQTHSKSTSESLKLVFAGNHVVTFMGTTTSIRPDQNDSMVYSSEIMRSNYSFYKAALSVTPDQVHWFTDPKDSVAPASLLLLKNFTSAVIATHGIYSFETDEIRGFQFMKDTGVVYIDFFDKYDRQYGMVIASSTQQEIDAILSSITVQ